MNATLRTLAALALSATFSIAIPARADVVMSWASLSIVGEPAVVSSAPTEATFVVTNTGADPEEVVEPHLVLLDDGIRIPLRLTRYEVDGVARSRFEPFTLAPGASARIHVVFSDLADHGEASWELALSFLGMRSPATVTMTRR